MNAQSKTSNTIDIMTRFNKRFLITFKSNVKVYMYTYNSSKLREIDVCV